MTETRNSNTLLLTEHHHHHHNHHTHTHPNAHVKNVFENPFIDETGGVPQV